MIVVFLGGIGSGKTLSAIREIRKRKQFVFTNFNIKQIKDYHRIKFTDVIIPGEKKSDYDVNWKFWEKQRSKHDYFSIYLDEVHNIIDARASNTVINRLMSKWVSQIRKITSDTTQNNLFLISQKIRRIDVNFRELAHVFVECRKVQTFDKNDKPVKTFIVQDYFNGIDNYEKDRRACRLAFRAEPYYKYYDTTEMVKFSDVETYI